MILLERHHCLIFAELYKTLQLTRGSVDSHLRKLEDFNYITREVTFVNTSSQVLICATQAGLHALQEAKRIWSKLLDF